MGGLSYDGYLFHIPAVILLGRIVPIFTVSDSGAIRVDSHVALFLCAFPLTVATSWLSFAFFERRVGQMRWRQA